MDGDDLALWDTSRDPVPRTPPARLACPAKDGTEPSMTFGGPDAHMLAAAYGPDACSRMR